MKEEPAVRRARGKGASCSTLSGVGEERKGLTIVHRY